MLETYRELFGTTSTTLEILTPLPYFSVDYKQISKRASEMRSKMGIDAKYSAISKSAEALVSTLL